MSFSAPTDDDHRLGLDLAWQMTVDRAREEERLYCEYPGNLTRLHPKMPDCLRTQDLLLASAIPDDPKISYHTTIFEGLDAVCAFLDSIPDSDFSSTFHTELEDLYQTICNKFPENIFVVSLTDKNDRFIGFEICIYNRETATADSLFVLISPSHQGKKLQHVIFAKILDRLRSLGIKTLNASTSSHFQYGLEALAAKAFRLKRYTRYPDKSWHADFSYQL